MRCIQAKCGINTLFTNDKIFFLQRALFVGLGRKALTFTAHNKTIDAAKALKIWGNKQI